MPKGLSVRSRSVDDLFDRSLPDWLPAKTPKPPALDTAAQFGVVSQFIPDSMMGT